MNPWYAIPIKIQPQAKNLFQRSYAPGSAERKGLEAALSQMRRELPFDVPCVINGKPVGQSLPLYLVQQIHSLFLDLRR